MNLSVKNEKNMTYMLEKIIEKLQAIHIAPIKAEHFSIDCYDELFDLYSLITKKQQLSIREKDAILTELGNLRKKKYENRHSPSN